jgi:hypothetical protein
LTDGKGLAIHIYFNTPSHMWLNKVVVVVVIEKAET